MMDGQRPSPDPNRRPTNHLRSSDVELDALLHALCDDRLDEAGRSRLSSKLAASDDACRRYIEFMHLCVGLSYPYAAKGNPTLNNENGLPEREAMSAEIAAAAGSPQASDVLPLLGDSVDPGAVEPTRIGAWSSLFGTHVWMLGPALGALALATILWTSGLGGGGREKGPLVVDRVPDDPNPDLARSNHSTPPSMGTESPDETPPSAYVARIVAASDDCKWGDQNAPVEFLVRVRQGDRIHILDGLLELEFYSGARLILHGPTVFTPTGFAAGHLESGRVTGEVSEGDFNLMTPAAEVIDLGTSFGVAADKDIGTDVVVFDGRVQVVSRTGEQPGATSIDMTQGMAARFRIDGTTEYDLKTDAKQFARQVPTSSQRQNADELCLIDVIAGGDGAGSGLAGAIDPATGRRDYGKDGRELPLQQRRTNVAFHPVSWHPLIDGVVVPSADGRAVRVTSQGATFDFPPSEGFTWSSIWARRAESALATDKELNIDFWGRRTQKGIVERLKTVRNGLVGVHANAGLTFDLRRMQMVHHRVPVEFRGRVANIENSADWPPDERPNYRRTVNFHVLVDGKLRYERMAFRLEDGDAEFVVPLGADDQFLTVVATDDGHIEFDHVVLIDPVILLDG